MSYGLLGEKLGHSFSKILHAQMGNDDYELISVPKDQVDDYLEKADFDGINVTIPYKEIAMRYCEPDAIAKDIGCVNTLLKKQGKVYGYNTDCLGFAYLARHTGVSWTGKKVVILGSGGTSKTASYVAVKSGASEVVIVSRKMISDIHATGWRSRLTYSTYDRTEEWTDAQIIINTTPVGMYPANDGIPVDIDIFESPEAVLDVIYNPLNTGLVMEAKKRGIPAACGLSMLVAQGWYSEEIWKAGEKGVDESMLDINSIPSKEFCEAIDRVTEVIYKQKRNIVLTGMPGSGKSTVGKRLSEALNREFVDTDELFKDKYSISAGDYITKYGVEAFREKESEVVKEAAKEGGRIIATGGGAVLRDDNRMALKANGFIVFLNREPKKLATDGRPLSQANGVMKLYEERLPVYKAFMDIEIDVNDKSEKTLRSVLEQL